MQIRFLILVKSLEFLMRLLPLVVATCSAGLLPLSPRQEDRPTTLLKHLPGHLLNRDEDTAGNPPHTPHGFADLCLSHRLGRISGSLNNILTSLMRFRPVFGSSFCTTHLTGKAYSCSCACFPSAAEWEATVSPPECLI